MSTETETDPVVGLLRLYAREIRRLADVASAETDGFPRKKRANLDRLMGELRSVAQDLCAMADGRARRPAHGE